MPSSYVIGDHFESFIKEQIRQRRYASASEVVRDGLRAIEDREKLRAAKLEALHAELQRGADSGAGIPSKAVFASVKQAHRRSRRWATEPSLKVVFSPAAQADLMDIAIFIAPDNPTRALTFVDERGDALEADNPSER